MVSLLDVGALSREVPVRGDTVTVTGVSAEGVVYLLSKFPDLRKFFAGQGGDISAETLIKLAPDIVASIIASGTGLPGNEKAEKLAASLGFGEQIDILSAIIELTFPQGVGPFVEKLHAFADGVGVSGWDPGTRSPAQSSGASASGTRPPSRGLIPRDGSPDGSSSQTGGVPEN